MSFLNEVRKSIQDLKEDFNEVKHLKKHKNPEILEMNISISQRSSTETLSNRLD